MCAMFCRPTKEGPVLAPAFHHANDRRSYSGYPPKKVLLHFAAEPHAHHAAMADRLEPLGALLGAWLGAFTLGALLGAAA